MIYKILKLVVGLGIRLYYREIRVKNVKHIAESKARIIIANHPNTMMDGWLLSYISKDPIYFLAKGTFFNSRLKRWLLKSLGLIPINRAADIATKGVDNVGSFEACYHLLEQGKTVVIFPEGTSYSERQLRELKSGTARIALEVEKRGKLNTPLDIIPVGLVYSKPEQFRSSVLVSVGEPIVAQPYLPLYKDNSSKAAKQLTAVFTEKLSGLLVNAQSNNYDDLVDQLVLFYGGRSARLKKNGVEKNVDFIREINNRINSIKTESPDKLEVIKFEVNAISKELDDFQISPSFLDRNYRSIMFVRQILQSIIALVIGLPFFIFGVFHNFIPYKTVDFIIPKLIKDIEYYAPVAVLMGLVLYPLNYFGFVWLMDYFFELDFWKKVVYFISMPIMGILAHQFNLYSNHIMLKTNYVIHMKTEKDDLLALKNRKDKLYDIIFTFDTQD